MRGDGSWTAFGHTAGHTSNDGNVCPQGTRCGPEFDDSPRSAGWRRLLSFSFSLHAGKKAARERQFDSLLRVAADHLLRVWRDGGTQGLATALPFIHRDVQESLSACRERGETLGLASFHAGVTRAAVVVRSVGAEDVEAALLALRSAER